MPILVSCADHCFAPAPHATRFERARRLGFTAVDVVLVGGYTWLQPNDVRADITGTAASVRRAAAGHGLAIADVMVLPGFDYAELAVSDPDPVVAADSRAWFGDMLEFATLVGSPGMTILPGVTNGGEPPAVAIGRASAELAWRVTAAAARGVELSVEPHVGSSIERPAAVRDLLEAVPGLQLTLDHTHFVAQGYSQAAADNLIGRARHIQTRGARPGRTQERLAGSTMNFQALIASLQNAGYSGYLGVEYGWTKHDHPHHFDSEAEAEALRRELTRLLSGVAPESAHSDEPSPADRAR